MAVISPPILKLLSDLDIDLMDVDSDMDYLRALMEATNSLTLPSSPSTLAKVFLCIAKDLLKVLCNLATSIPNPFSSPPTLPSNLK